MTKKEVKKEIFFVALFILIFALILTLATLLLYPKRNPVSDSNNISNGIYLEDKNSIDVLLVGSCNMYTSFNPLIFYENTGITSFDRTSPDQNMIISYYYIEEALKRQKPKVVVLDSLFICTEMSTDFEAYNRDAVDYMWPTASKMRLINALVKKEVPLMQSQNPQSPGKILTWAGYVFPLLRYHQRIPANFRDVSFFFNYTGYNYQRGSQAHSTYNNMNFEYDYVANTTKVRDDAREYVPEIIELCKKHNVPLIFINTPNNYRWDDATVSATKNFIESLGGTFLDLHSDYSDMIKTYNYQEQTGRMNIYGMEIFTERLGNYLIEKYNLKPTPLSEAKKKQWQRDIDTLYEQMKKEGADLTDGQISRICNENDSIFIRWNLFKDCNKYEVYRRSETEKEFVSVGQFEDNVYYDSDVRESEKYSYYIVPCEGAHKGQKSDEASYVYVKKPENVSVVRNGSEIDVSWGKDDLYDSYSVQKREYGDDSFEDYKTTDVPQLADTEFDDDVIYFYKVMNCIEKDGEKYYSDGTAGREAQ